MIEEADAWFEYLEATRGQTALRYREVEPWDVADRLRHELEEKGYEGLRKELGIETQVELDEGVA